MPRSNSRLHTGYCLILSLLWGYHPVLARAKKPVEDFSPTLAPSSDTASSNIGPANGAIFRPQFGYAPLTSGARAAMVGDVLSIMLVERMNAAKSNSAQTARSGNVGVTPPVTGPLAIFTPDQVNMGGDQSFTGKGAAAQSNSLTGEVSVTIAAIYPNGTMLVRGEKRLTLNRGDEIVQISGLVRAADISADNQVLSTRVADARIRYTGKGELARASQQGWLQRFFSSVSPF